MELTLGAVILLVGVFAGGAFLGVLLGRRSQTANETVDRIREKWDEEVAELRAEIDALKAKSKG